MSTNRIWNNKTIWYSPKVSHYERKVMDYIGDILWQRPDLDGYWLRVDSGDEAEWLEREEEGV